MADENEITASTVVTKPTFSPVRASVGLQLDIESLDVGPRSVITQIALYGYDLDSGEPLPMPIWHFMPVQPQLDLIHPRTISAQTLWWWFQQSDEARAKFELSLDDDFEALPILMRGLTQGFNRMTNNGTADYILIARGPQFDVTNVESLYKDCGLKAPWEYNRVVDLRTLLREAGITKEVEKEMEKPKGFVPHMASWDCRWQMDLYFEARRRLRSEG